MQSVDIRKIIEEECEDYFLGIADLSLEKENIDENYKSLVSIYPRAISIGITLPYKITDVTNHTNELYNTTNQKLNSITSCLSGSLEDEGYKALAVPKEGSINNGIFVSLHNLAASKADLGMIRNNTIITPEVGQRVNWGTVITDAPL